MHSEDIHIADHELVAFADHELASRRAAQVRDHLAACWTCRTRQAEIEETIGIFVRLHHGGLDAQIPPVPGPRALLKARLRSLAGESRRGSWSRRLQLAVSGWRLAYVCAAVLVILMAGVEGWRKPFHSREAGTPIARSNPKPIPNRWLTPGAIRPVKLADVCGAGRDEKNRMVPVSVRQEVFKKYGMTGAPPQDYEVDYLITPDLGGSDDIQNLWPEPYSSTAWSAYVKDALEDRLHELVCEGQIDLPTAQREIATDWIGAYKKYFHTDRPLLEHPGRQVARANAS